MWDLTCSPATLPVLWTLGLQFSQAWLLKQDRARLLVSSPGQQTPSFLRGGTQTSFGPLTSSRRAMSVTHQEQFEIRNPGLCEFPSLSQPSHPLPEQGPLLCKEFPRNPPP